MRKTNNVLRPTLWPSLLRACKTNQDAGNGAVSLFELAAVFPPGQGQLPDEKIELAMVTFQASDLTEGIADYLVRGLDDTPGGIR